MIHRDAQGQAEAIPRETVPVLFVCVVLFCYLSLISENSIE